MGAHQDPDTVGACAVHGLVVHGGACRAVGTLDSSLVALDPPQAALRGTGVTVRGVGGGADSTCGRCVALFLSVAGALAVKALAGEMDGCAALKLHLRLNRNPKCNSLAQEGDLNETTVLVIQFADQGSAIVGVVPG